MLLKVCLDKEVWGLGHGETMKTWRDVVTILQAIPNYEQKFAGLTWRRAKDEWEDMWAQYLKNREEVPYQSGSAEQYEEWKDVMECIYQLTGDEDVVEQGVNSKADLKQRDKDMAAAGEMIRSKNLNQFKKRAHQNLPDRAEDGKRPAHSPMDQLCIGMSAFLESQTPTEVKVQQPSKKYKLSSFGDEVKNVLELVGMKDQELLNEYARNLIFNGFETPDLLMACTFDDFVGMKFKNGHALKMVKVLSQIEDDVDI